MFFAFFFLCFLALQVFFFLFLLFLLLQLPVMPKRQRLSQAELEVHQVLSPDDSASTVSAPTAPPSQQEHVKIMSSMRSSQAPGSEALRAPDTQAPVTLADMKELFGDLKLSIVDALRVRDRPRSSESSYSESSEGEARTSEKPTGEYDIAPPIFGVDVNEPLRSDVPVVAVPPSASRSCSR